MKPLSALIVEVFPAISYRLTYQNSLRVMTKGVPPSVLVNTFCMYMYMCVYIHVPSFLAISSKSGGIGLRHAMERGPNTVVSSMATDRVYKNRIKLVYTCTMHQVRALSGKVVGCWAQSNQLEIVYTKRHYTR